MLTIALFAIMILAAVYAAETREFRNSIYAVALVGVGVAIFQLAEGAPVPAALQLIAAFVVTYAFNRTLLPKSSPREYAEGEMISRLVSLLFIVLSVVLACGIAAAVAPMNYYRYLLSLLLVLAGIYAVAFKKDIKKIVAGIVIAGYAGEALLVLAGEKQGITPLAGLAAAVLLSFIASRLIDRLGADITKIRELRG
ncbi:MAG TPA: hypothetical protein VMD02_05635 [Candidatus Omnitrophota bacterium]|nr:hypothetical protein [Candidatus Omnitrophota bacterium]